MATSLSFALTEISKGSWPDTWPKELEKFRERSLSYYHDLGIEEVYHEITFKNREEFEQAWPYILSLKTKDAPLTIKSTHILTGRYGSPVQIREPKVQIYCTYPGGPNTGKISTEQSLKWPVPWPDYIKLPSGGLPEYVTYKDGKWVEADIKQIRESGKEQPLFEGNVCRARVDIVLYSDSNIVDLNRIPLPPDTPIIDKRFNNSDDN